MRYEIIKEWNCIQKKTFLFPIFRYYHEEKRGRRNKWKSWVNVLRLAPIICKPFYSALAHIFSVVVKTSMIRIVLTRHLKGIIKQALIGNIFILTLKHKLILGIYHSLIYCYPQPLHLKLSNAFWLCKLSSLHDNNAAFGSNAICRRPSAASVLAFCQKEKIWLSARYYT